MDVQFVESEVIEAEEVQGVKMGRMVPMGRLALLANGAPWDLRASMVVLARMVRQVGRASVGQEADQGGLAVMERVHHLAGMGSQAE
jgi:hypothetical protein